LPYGPEIGQIRLPYWPNLAVIFIGQIRPPFALAEFGRHIEFGCHIGWKSVALCVMYWLPYRLEITCHMEMKTGCHLIKVFYPTLH